MSSNYYLVIGNSGSGKTQFINKKLGLAFEKKYNPTNGLAFYAVDENTTFIEKGGEGIFDISGDEMKVMKKAKFAYLCLDASHQHFIHFEIWIDILNELGIPYQIVLTKSDIHMNTNKLHFTKKLNKNQYLYHSSI